MDPALEGSDNEVENASMQQVVEAMDSSPSDGMGKDNGHEGVDGDESGEGKKRKKAWRVMLAPESAIEIYKRRPPLDEANGKYPHGSMRNASQVALEYNVSPKTIRDIWNRYSWAKVTRSLWTEQEAIHYSTTYPVRGHQGTGVLSEVAAKSMGGQNRMLMGGGVAHRPPMVQHFQHHQCMQQMPPAHPHPQMMAHAHQHQHQHQPQPAHHQHMGSFAYNTSAHTHSAGNQMANSQNMAKRMRCDTQAPAAQYTQRMGSASASAGPFLSSTADDIGIGSLDQITQFNDEVDQIVGQLPIGLFPSAGGSGIAKDTAAQKLGDDSSLFLHNMPGLSRSEQHHPQQQGQQPFYGVSGVHEMMQHLLMGVATPQGMPPQHQHQHQQAAPEPALDNNGNLEEQIGAARNRLNQLLALSKQQNNGQQQPRPNNSMGSMATGMNSMNSSMNSGMGTNSVGMHSGVY